MPSGEMVQIQLLSHDGYPNWPTELTPLEQRYSTVPDAALPVPTPPAFVASKTMAWVDRRAVRDLYDLWALADAGFFTYTAGQLYRQHGPSGEPPPMRDFEDPPSEREWLVALGHQGTVRTDHAAAANVVAAAWAAIS